MHCGVVGVVALLSHVLAGNVEDLIKDGLVTPGAIALDLRPHEPKNKMYWTDAGTKLIQRANLDGSSVENLVTWKAGLIAPWGIALDTAAAKMYWTDGGNHTINRANLDGSSVEVLVQGLKVPWGIALDVPSNKMWWMDGGSRKIQSSTLDGKDVKDLVTLGKMGGIDVAVDTSSNTMYYSSWMAIYHAQLDGSKNGTVVKDLPAPAWSVAVDSKAGKVYWADGEMGGRKISRANTDGSSAEDLVVKLGLPQGLALDVEGKKMYWTDLETKKIQRAPMDGVGHSILQV